MFDIPFLSSKNNTKLTLLLWLLLISYCLLRAVYYFNGVPGGGDESIFIEAHQRIRDIGWIAAIESQFPATYAIITYPLSMIFQDYVAIRVTNVLLLLVFGFYLYKRFAMKEVWFYAAFFLFTTSFLTGTNDALFQLALSVFLLETLLFTTQKKFNTALAFTALIVAAFTREMVVIFMPAILLALFILRQRKFRMVEFSLPMAVTLLLIGLHWPSLSANGKPSYDQKEPPAELNANWAERQYLSQLMVNEGKLEDKKHVTWEEVVAYKKEHGENSLPKSIGQGILFDPVLTVKEFFKDFADMLVASVRQTGIIQIYCMIAFFVLLFKRRSVAELYVPAVVLSVFGIFALIIISYVEMRWLVPISVLACVYFGQTENQCQNPRFSKLFLANYVLLALIMCYGNYKIITALL